MGLSKKEINVLQFKKLQGFDRSQRGRLKTWLGQVLRTLTSLKTWIGPVFVSLHGPAALTVLPQRISTYRIGSFKAPGFYFSKWEFGWGSIDIIPAWGCNQDGVIFIRPNLEFWTIKSNKINQNTYADASIIELCFIILASVHVLWLILFDFKVVFEIHLLHVLILTVQISFGILYLGGVQFEMGFYSFNICFLVGF